MNMLMNISGARTSRQGQGWFGETETELETERGWNGEREVPGGLGGGGGGGRERALSCGSVRVGRAKCPSSLLT